MMVGSALITFWSGIKALPRRLASISTGKNAIRSPRTKGIVRKVAKKSTVGRPENRKKPQSGLALPSKSRTKDRFYLAECLGTVEKGPTRQGNGLRAVPRLSREWHG